MSAQYFDTVVVGGGPGGYVAAIRAAQLGLSVALVEREHLGGVCLNWGCIPTKALLHGADLLREMRSSAEFGIQAEPKVDLAAMVARSRAAANQLNKGVGGLLRKNGVTVFDGIGRLDGPGRLRVGLTEGGEAELESDAIILATGARARTLPHIQPDGERIWTAREAMVPEALPERLLVIGAGAIGTEFASFYATLGSQVTQVEMLPHVLPLEDPEISEAMRAALERDGVEVITGAAVTALERSGDGLEATFDIGGESRTATFDRAILAIGVTGNVEDAGLDTTAVSVDRGFVEIDDYWETGERGVFAIGDVAGPPCLAHKASHEGVLLAEMIAGQDVHPLRHDRVPSCTYAHPQVASVGLTEDAARERGHEVRVGRFPLIGNGRAIAIGDSEGMIKTVFDATTGELLGAHLIGPGVTELIQGFTVAIGLETTEAELIETVFPHPTISEAMHESVLAAYERPIHI